MNLTELIKNNSYKVVKSNPDEIWKDIPNYKGFYQVSNLGNVKSLDRNVYYKDGRIGFYKSVLLKPNIKKHGYYYVVLTKSNKQQTYYIHKLVAISFMNHKPNGYSLVIDHIDNNKLNNRLDNLRIVTQRVNVTKKSKGKSNLLGASWHSPTQKWRSYIKIDDKSKYLGVFKNDRDAHEAYMKVFNKIEI